MALGDPREEVIRSQMDCDPQAENGRFKQLVQGRVYKQQACRLTSD